MRGREVVHVQEPYEVAPGCLVSEVLRASEPAGPVLDDKLGIVAAGAYFFYRVEGAVVGTDIHDEYKLEIGEGLAVDVIDEAPEVRLAVVNAGHYGDLRRFPSLHAVWIREVLFDVGDNFGIVCNP